MSAVSVNELLARGCSEHWQTRAEARNECSTEEFGAICSELVALRKQSELDRQSREASQTEFARLNRERNKALFDRDQAMGAAQMANELSAALSGDVARLNRELNEAKETGRAMVEERDDVLELMNEQSSRIRALLAEIADVAIAAGMMDPGRRGSLDGPNAIQFLRQMKDEYDRREA